LSPLFNSPTHKGEIKLADNNVVKVGDVVTIKLDNLASGGDVVGRKDGFAIFVPQGVPEEIVKVEIIEARKSYAKGKIIEIVEESDKRVVPECEIANLCGGCQIAQIDYQAQLNYKQKIVKDAIERIGRLKGIKINPVKGMDTPLFYRNKAQFPLGIRDNRVITGFYAPKTHQIIEIEDCKIQHPLINRIIKETIELIEEYQLSIYDEKKHTGLLRHLVVRVGVCTNQALLVIVTKDNKFPEGRDLAERLMEKIPELSGVQQNINSKKTNVVLGKITKTLSGTDYITDYIGEVKYKISPLSFFQVNTLQTKVLYDQVVEYAQLTGEEQVVDAYCGLGSISLYLAAQAKQVYGIEVIEEAIEMAKKNAELNGIDNCDFSVGKVRDILPNLQNKIRPDLIVVDPPRKGCHQDVLKEFANIKPDKIIYVSCNPASLARDLKIMCQLGYEVVEIQPVDMFPQTYHVESVVLLRSISDYN